MLVETSTVTGHFFYKALDQSKKIKMLIFTAYSVLPNSRLQDWISNFLKKTGPQKLVNAC